MPSLREEIEQGLVQRLETIKAVNGYETDIANVFSDSIPMGLQLDEFELPAILVIAGDDQLERVQGCVRGNWNFELQLFHNDVTDSVMNRFVRDIGKAIFANSPTGQRTEAFRGPSPGGIHESVYDAWINNIESDLNMIEANRFYVLSLVLRYTTKIHNL